MTDISLGSIVGSVESGVKTAADKTGQFLVQHNTVGHVADAVFGAAEYVKNYIHPDLPTANAPEAGQSPRDIYVIMSGLGSAGNGEGKNEVAELEAHGISPNDIVLHNSPFPKLDTPADVAKNLVQYAQVADPNGKLSQSEDKTLDQELKAHGVTSADHLMLIGHSAGGQEAASESKLLDKNGYKVDTVVTMGTPFATNETPKNTRLVVAESDGDPVLADTQDTVGTTRKPANFESYANRKHIELPAVDASGQPNDHESYMKPDTFWDIIQTARNTQDVDTAPWHPAVEPLDPSLATDVLKKVQ